MSRPLDLSTRVVHGGERRHSLPETPTVGPIYLSNTYTLSDPAEMDAILGGARQGYTYARHGSPTLAALEEVLADLEGGEAAQTYGSGMAALHGALLAVGLAPGDVLLASRDLYGATATLMKEVLGAAGVRTVFRDTADTEAVLRDLEELRPRALLLESISNPLLRVADLPVLLAAARQRGIRTIVDNTFATPYLMRPLSLGADMVVHSTTKYLNGHGDVMGGVVVTDRETAGRLHTAQKLTGAVLGPMEAWLTLRGLKTFALRFPRQLASATVLAQRLDGHPRVGRVYHPSLSHHPDQERALALLPRGQGAVLSFEVRGGREQVYRLMRNLRVVVPGTTVGDIYSLLLYPVMASHRSLSPQERLASGITEELVRLAVGIEDVEDIWQDLAGALEELA